MSALGREEDNYNFDDNDIIIIIKELWQLWQWRWWWWPTWGLEGVGPERPRGAQIVQPPSSEAEKGSINLGFSISTSSNIQIVNHHGCPKSQASMFKGWKRDIDNSWFTKTRYLKGPKCQFLWVGSIHIKKVVKDFQFQDCCHQSHGSLRSTLDNCLTSIGRLEL